MATLTPDDINNEREALVLLIAELGKAEDQEELNQLLAMIQAQAASLETMATAYGEEVEATYDTEASQAFEASQPKVEVVLTPEQRQRVFQAHGVDFPSVIISDPIGLKTLEMPETAQIPIEAEAMKSAEEFNRMVAAQAEAQAAVADAIAEIEAADNPALQAALQKAREDPDFAGGMAAKK